MYFRVAIIITALSLSACSSWVFRYDVPQGNYLEQKSIDKLQVGMTKEQVKFILGSPVVVDAFDNDTWNYVYKLKSGRSRDFDMKKQFIINFSNDKLISASGDFELSDNFNIPFNAPTVQAEPANVNNVGKEQNPVVKNKTTDGK
jgi:outer membrane protein assembly factor BamE